MNVVIIGGKLQGVEAVYLAKEAGWYTILIDKNYDAPAVGMCDEFHKLNVLGESQELVKIIEGKDLIIIALEDIKVVKYIQEIAKITKVPMVFDLDANLISSSKLKSDQLFAENDIPSPNYWPNCEFPVIAKPSDLSGSHGVRKFTDPATLSEFIQDIQSKEEEWVIQEYLQGSSFSLEVIGCNGKYLTLQTTEIQVDAGYDCKRVLAPVEISKTLEKELHQITEKIARILNLTGIMDVEVIDHNGSLKVLEIDARLPSQTPIVVYQSTGINILELLADVYIHGRLPETNLGLKNKYVIFEHILVSPRSIKTLGEHIMGEAGPLKNYKGMFGADEFITSYTKDKANWVATLIITGDNRKIAWQKRSDILTNIMREHNIPLHFDSEPKVL